MKVIIAGGRDFEDYSLLYQTCEKAFVLQHQNIEVVSGTASGADRIGEKYAKEKEYTIKKFPADWDKNGKKAGYIRNEEMAKYADALIAFWDGKSKGTKHMIDIAKRYNLKIKIIIYEKI